MSEFFSQWQQAAQTTLGLFWMAFWAFGFGYLVSSMIQVFVTRERMRKSMGEAGSKSVVLATFFGFLSSSCSFAALSTTRALFTKGAGLIPSLAFLLASTNLVVELGIVIAVFLGWQFVVGEYLGGMLLILGMWLLVKMSRSKRLEDHAREHAREAEGGDHQHGDNQNWQAKMKSRDGWRQVASQYFMEWQMVWKDVTVGFTLAGIIAVFVPRAFFQTLFIGAGNDSNTFAEVLAQTIIGPLAAFFTFIGSMGNIPLAAVLFGNGVSFAGVMAFIFSDLVVFPVLRIQAQYYGWKMAFYILLVFLAALVGTALILHYGFAGLNLLPEPGAGRAISEREFFKLNYTAALNGAFAVMSAGFVIWHWRQGHQMTQGRSWSETILLVLTAIAFCWLIIGAAVLPFFGQ